MVLAADMSHLFLLLPLLIQTLRSPNHWKILPFAYFLMASALLEHHRMNLLPQSNFLVLQRHFPEVSLPGLKLR